MKCFNCKNNGEGNAEKTNRLVLLFVYISAASGIVFAVLGIIFIHLIASFLEAESTILNDSVIYGRIILAALTAYMLQFEFQSFLLRRRILH